MGPGFQWASVMLRGVATHQPQPRGKHPQLEVHSDIFSNYPFLWDVFFVLLVSIPFRALGLFALCVFAFVFSERDDLTMRDLATAVERGSHLHPGSARACQS